MKQWWGPKCYTCPTAKIDFRVGNSPPVIPLRTRLEQFIEQETVMTGVQPHLVFDGLCEEAIDFYRRKLGAKVHMLMRAVPRETQP